MCIRDRFLIAKINSVDLGDDSRMIQTSNPQKLESPAKTLVLLESCRLSCVLVMYTQLEITLHAGTIPFGPRQKPLIDAVQGFC